MPLAVIGRWGKSLAIRFPTEVVGDLGLHEGDHVEIDAQTDVITIRPTRPVYRLKNLFAGKSAGEWRSLYASAYDWGSDRGREAVEG